MELTEEILIAGAKEAHHTLNYCSCPGYPNYQCMVNQKGIESFRKAVEMMFKVMQEAK